MLTTLEKLSTPVLTWIAGAERLDLTGVVVANWIHKCRGLLAELEVESLVIAAHELPDSSLRLHWRELVVAIAAESLGLPLRITSAATGAPEDDEVVLIDAAELTEHPHWAAAWDVVAYAAPALALQAQVDDNTVDFNSAVRSQADISAPGWDEAYAAELSSSALPPVTQLAAYPHTRTQWLGLVANLLHGTPITLTAASV